MCLLEDHKAGYDLQYVWLSPNTSFASFRSEGGIHPETSKEDGTFCDECRDGVVEQACAKLDGVVWGYLDVCGRTC